MRIMQLNILKTIKLIIILLIIISCSNQELSTNDLKEGKYAWKKQSTAEIIYYKLVHDIMIEIGDTLTLFDNINFAYTNCGTYGFGKYEILGDSLFLNYDSSATHKDSIMRYDKYTETYFIEDENTLSREFKIKYSLDSKEKHNAMSKLHYIEIKQPTQ